MVVRFLTPLRTSARIRFSGIPHSPNPPTMIVAPSEMSRIASSELVTTFFIRSQILKHFHHRDAEPQRNLKNNKRRCHSEPPQAERNLLSLAHSKSLAALPNKH